MGNTQSGVNFNTGCRNISNDEVVFFTKQYFTLNKLIDILIDIENGTKTDLNPPVQFMVDLSTSIPDIVNGQPSELSVQLFNPKPQLVAIEMGQPVEILYTVLHRYNDFVLKEVNILDSDVKKERAKNLREEMVEITKKLLSYITEFCSDVGIITEQ